MSAYRIGLSLATSEMQIVGVASQERPKTGWDLAIVLGLVGVTFIVLPGKKGWQKALGDK